MLLNTLLVVIALLFLAIGFRRGVIREIFVTAGVLAGALLSSYWARPWGGDLAEAFGLSTGTGQYIVSSAFIIGSMLVLGYGAALAMDFDDGAPVRRATGALLGFVNGALLFGFLLRDVERFIADDATLRLLRQSTIAWALLRQPGWILFIAAMSFGLIILASIVTGRRAHHQPAFAADRSRPKSQSAAADSSRRSPRLRWGRDGDKVEPVPASLFGTGGDPFTQTMPLAPVDGGTWTDRSRTSSMSGADWMEIRSDPGTQGSSAAIQVGNPGSSSHCAACGERLSNRDLYCPRCGRAGSN